MNKEEIYRSYIKDVYKYTFYILKNKEQSEDLTSEAFLRFFESKSNITSTNIKPYIIGIARNMIFDKYKDKSYQNYSLFNSSGEIIEFEDKQYNMEDNEIDNNLIATIKNNLDKLDKLTQEIIILKIWEELKFNEIAEIVKENINTVKTLYYKGITQLKFILNSNSSLKLKSITLPTLLTGLLLISSNNEFNISQTIITSLTKQIILFNRIHMDTATGSAAVIAKTGFLATTAGKIAIGVASIAAVATSAGIGALIVNNNKVNPSTDNSSTSSSLSIGFPSSISSSSDINSGLSSSSFTSSSSLSNSISSSSSIFMSSSSLSVIPDVKQFKSAKYGVNFSYQTLMGDIVVSNEPNSNNEVVTFTNSKLVFTYINNSGARGGGLSKDFPNPIKVSTKDGKEFSLLIQDSLDGTGKYNGKYDLYGFWTQVAQKSGVNNNFWITQSQQVSKDQINLNINFLKYLLPTMTISF